MLFGQTQLSLQEIPTTNTITPANTLYFVQKVLFATPADEITGRAAARKTSDHIIYLTQESPPIFIPWGDKYVKWSFTWRYCMMKGRTSC